MKPGTRAVHAGHEKKARQPLSPPIVQTAVYVYDNLEDFDSVARGDSPGHYYSRASNENVAMLAEAVADLEGAEAGVATSSGMAAILVAIGALAPRPCPIVAPLDLYGGTWVLFRQELEPVGFTTRIVDFTDLDAVGRALDGAGLVVCETIPNPLVRIADLEALCRMAGERGIPVLVDNTFATPVLCRPPELVATMQRASTSMLQTKLKLGFARASRVMDELERYGIIGPQDPRNPASPRHIYGPDNWLRTVDDSDGSDEGTIVPCPRSGPTALTGYPLCRGRPPTPPG